MPEAARTEEEVIDDRRFNPDDIAHQVAVHLVALRRRLRAGNVMLRAVLCWHLGLRLHAQMCVTTLVIPGSEKAGCPADDLNC